MEAAIVEGIGFSSVSNEHELLSEEGKWDGLFSEIPGPHDGIPVVRKSQSCGVVAGPRAPAASAGGEFRAAHS